MQILLASYDSNLMHRVSVALDGMAAVVRSDPDAFSLRDAVLRASPDLVILDMEAAAEGGDDLLSVTRALTDHDPDRHVIAIGDESVPQAVLMGMRAGARDFLDRQIGDKELRARVGIYRERSRRRADAAQGRLVLIGAGMPSDCDGTLATNYAVLRAQSGSDTLFVDLAAPASEAATLLDIDATYTLRNAIADMARLDRTLLSSALGHHEASGLHVLPLPPIGDGHAPIGNDEMIDVLQALRGMFSEVVVNLGCITDAGLFHHLLREAGLVHLVALQKITSVKACRDVLNVADPSGQLRDHVHLVIDSYQDDIKLTDSQIQQTLGLKRASRIPAARTALFNALNTGVPIVIQQPKSGYARALMQLACPAPARAARSSIAQRLLGLRFREARTNA